MSEFSTPVQHPWYTNAMSENSTRLKILCNSPKKIIGNAYS